MQKHFKLISTFFITLFFAFSLQAQTSGQAYNVQPNDWLSKISSRVYQNPHLYYRIIEGTNEKALNDNSFQKIGSANTLRIGQKIWIPESTLSTNQPPTEPAEDEGNLVNIPKTDCEIRIWYNYQVVAISRLNEKWEQDGLDLATRAQKAYELRHDARVNARFMMADQSAVKKLQERDMQKYGNPDGPTFDYLVKKVGKDGLSQQDIYQSIIESSSRTSPVFNKDCQ